MGPLNQLKSSALYSSDPPYYTYGAPQVPLQPANPPQEMQLATQQPRIQRFAKGGPGSPDIKASLSNLRQAAQEPDDLQAGYPGEAEADYGAGDEGGEYVEGPGTGRSDSIPAELSDGEYVFDAETVALLGDGSSKAGAAALDELRRRIREHKGAALAKGEFSPDAKPAEAYLEGTAKLAGGGRPRPKQSLAKAADQQDMADKDGEDPGRETARVGNTKKSYKDVKDAQSAEQWRRNGWK